MINEKRLAELREIFKFENDIRLHAWRKAAGK